MTAFREASKNQFANIDDATRAKVTAYLNYYELVAIGCKNNVLDKKFMSDFMRTAYVRDWYRAENYIFTIRNPGNKTPRNQIFSNFEKLAKEWELEIKREESGSR